MLWFLSIVLSGIGLRLFCSSLYPVLDDLRGRKKRSELEDAVDAVHEVEEIIAGGLIPTAIQWERLQNLAHPWGPLIGHSMTSLRSNGAMVLPTLKRYRELIQRQIQFLEKGLLGSSQALFQALSCSALAPLLGVCLYGLIPELQDQTYLWLGMIVFASVLSLGGAYWIVLMTVDAMTGGLPPHNKHWLYLIPASGEFFLSLVRSGQSPDHAWSETHHSLASMDAPLADLWGRSVWQNSSVSPHVILGTVSELRKGIQLGVMEGRSNLERVESQLLSIEVSFESLVQSKLNLLSVKALKPLYLLGAPGVFGLMIGAFVILLSGY